MFGRKKMDVDPASVDNIVWFRRKGDDKRNVTQWMDEDFYRLWMGSMKWAFDLLGMMDQYKRFVEEIREEAESNLGVPVGLVPVRGWRNRHSLRTAAENLENAFPVFELIRVKGGQVLRHKGEKVKALEQWEAVTDLLGKTTVVSFVTPGLQYYVEGSLAGYPSVIRHLFRQGNTVERLGTPLEPAWRLNISGYTVVVVGKWSEIEKTRRELGYNIFQML
jgi:hypothetical protein